MCNGPEVGRETDIFKEQKEGQYEQVIVKSLDFILNTMDIPRNVKQKKNDM